jgi:hypothetical protein
MLVIDNEKAARIEAFAGKIAHIFEIIAGLNQLTGNEHPDVLTENADILFEKMHTLSHQEDIKTIFELFKNIANARTDKYLAMVHPEVVVRDKMIALLLRNDYNSQPSHEDSEPPFTWVQERWKTLRQIAEDGIAG